ncbi:MAG TPA: hypothetical protein VFK70_00810, partial [Vicinamibacteria bacterium]|nr:hypothetical protein [Vicinamibacteria bacterium]
ELAEALPPWVTAVAEARGLVMDRAGAAVELYPVLAGAVIEEAMASTTLDGLEGAVAALRWPAPSEPRDDTPWLLPWLHGKRTGTYVDLGPDEPAATITERLRA